MRAPRGTPCCRRGRSSCAGCGRTPRPANTESRSRRSTALSGSRNTTHVRHHGSIHKPRRGVIVHRTRTHRMHWLHGISRDPHHGGLVPRRQCSRHGHGAAIDRNQSSAGHAPWSAGAHRRTVSAKARANVWTNVESGAPPGIAPPNSRRPSPAEAVVPVPIAARIRQIAPGVG